MQSEQLQDWLLLYHGAKASGRRLSRLLHSLGDPGRVLDQPVSLLTASGLEPALAEAISRAREPQSVAHQRMLLDMDWLTQPGHHILCWPDAFYPPLLREIADPPPVLYVAGDPQVLSQPMLAIVGSRNSSRYGRDIAATLSRELCRAGLVISSGLASGIDTAAHRAAVENCRPTVAVLGSGLKNVYPLANRQLASKITGGEVNGAVVSEFPLNTAPDTFHFPQRNRIISGMSLGVCVVEASLRSGSLITARLALEQNRNVFAVPGSVNMPGSRGCHQLLRDGATLTENAADVIDALQPLLQGQIELLEKVKEQTSRARLPSGCRDLFKLIGDDPITTDQLQRLSGLSHAELAARLLKLEISGHIYRSAGKWALNR
ncbi:DNA-processing protein DprA [Pseudohongiella spirulinae]|uniref:DNA processing protein DprA n=1 Tax=Pseudohongiella spirulinae TaxID=1249552 RepID=A0A0S2K907_9GAMM|nr:DNA-processing protein DprA [Pseudohongiella spirulinae]ALO44713.1 DNA processing protein DprA [Pseudohongiella spirulinae]